MYLTKAGQPNAWSLQAAFMHRSKSTVLALRMLDRNHFVLVGLGVEQLKELKGLNVLKQHTAYINLDQLTNPSVESQVSCCRLFLSWWNALGETSASSPNTLKAGCWLNSRHGWWDFNPRLEGMEDVLSIELKKSMSRVSRRNEKSQTLWFGRIQSNGFLITSTAALPSHRNCICLKTQWEIVLTLWRYQKVLWRQQQMLKRRTSVSLSPHCHCCWKDVNSSVGCWR